jgi:hypothetical protein
MGGRPADYALTSCGLWGYAPAPFSIVSLVHDLQYDQSWRNWRCESSVISSILWIVDGTLKPRQSVGEHRFIIISWSFILLQHRPKLPLQPRPEPIRLPALVSGVVWESMCTLVPRPLVCQGLAPVRCSLNIRRSNWGADGLQPVLDCDNLYGGRFALQVSRTDVIYKTEQRHFRGYTTRHPSVPFSMYDTQFFAYPTANAALCYSESY